MSTYDQKNAVAVNILRSWLRAINLPHTPNVPDVDLVVHGRFGDIRVLVPVTVQSSRSDVIQILASDITGKSKDLAIAAFQKITRAAGVIAKVPFDRPEPAVRSSYKNEEFLIAVRANETRRSPDPSPEHFRQYAHCLKTAANRFMNLNRELCVRWGYEVDDLHTIARTLFINFASRYEKFGAEQSENEKLLYSYLGQRFREFRSLLLKRDRCVYPDIGTVQISMCHNENIKLFSYRHPDTGIRVSDFSVDPFDDTPPGPKNYKPEYLDCSSSTTRKASAAEVLTARLGGLPHDQMVEVLAQAANSILINYGARQEAHKRLVGHVAGCIDCKANKELLDTLELVFEEEEELAGIDTGSLTESLVDFAKAEGA